MGSGTGIFSEELLKMGYTVYGVKPNGEMRAKAENRLAHYERFHSVTASAESTALPDAFVDFITAASAFHWFQPSPFAREAKRI